MKISPFFFLSRGLGPCCFGFGGGGGGRFEFGGGWGWVGVRVRGRVRVRSSSKVRRALYRVCAGMGTAVV